MDMNLRHVVLMLITSLAAAPSAQAQSLKTSQPKEGCIQTENLAPGRLMAQTAPGMIELGRGARVLRLEPACAADGRALSLAQRIAVAPPHRRFLLVIDDLRAGVQPGVLFDLRIAGASDHAARNRGDALLGTLNFYAAQRPGVAARPRRVSYDVSQVLRELASAGKLEGGLGLTIQPVAPPAPGSDATIGHIALVEQ